MWIEITISCVISVCNLCHLPRGRCGLKLFGSINQNLSFTSPSARKVWIEISKSEYIARVGKSPSARKVWIEMWIESVRKQAFASPSARKVWIEIYQGLYKCRFPYVTFREEGVDWNYHTPIKSLSAYRSPSARKVWIEIIYRYYSNWRQFCHLPRGRCGLKFTLFTPSIDRIPRHLPRGRCGLKFACAVVYTPQT